MGVTPSQFDSGKGHQSEPLARQISDILVSRYLISGGVHLSFLIPLFLSVVCAYAFELVGEPVCLTCGLRPSEYDYADPSTPDFSRDGEVTIYFTHGHKVTWRASSTEKAFDKAIAGKTPEEGLVELYDATGDYLDGPWDVNIHTLWSQRVLIAGVMVPAEAGILLNWPEDNWRRRISVFVQKQGRWTRLPDRLLGDPTDSFGWLNHSYGHDIIFDKVGTPWIFYERVARTKDFSPTITNIYSAPLYHDFEIGKEHLIIDSEEKSFLSTETFGGNHLVEGARILKHKNVYYLFFSAGSFDANDYGIHLGVLDSLPGAAKIYKNKSDDLCDFGGALRKKLQLTWGPGRPAAFMRGTDTWLLFHGIRKNSDCFQLNCRDTFLTKIKLDVKNSACRLQ